MSGPSRENAKRKVKPLEAQSLLDFDLAEGESSDDSDFRIEDHPEESDDYSINSDDEKKADSGSSEESGTDQDNYKDSIKKSGEESVVDILERAKRQDFKFPGKLADVLICSGCLGSRSDDYNEIVECDGCGVTVHEGCYGVSDVTSVSSTISSASTEPWFCEACKAGVTDPCCELCPNSGGIFKETEVGAWVHLVCALYVPGVAFSEVERLSGVTLFEMAYSRWGARACALCDDASLARAGVCVGCDAGLCKTFFHVTCGQREGLLAEAHSEEAEQADPFYAHCRMHSDKALVKKRKRNWLALQLRTAKRKQELETNTETEAKLRTQRKLVKYRRKYLAQKENRNPPWVPTQKMARMLFSSASAMRKFKLKAECMGIDIHALEFQDSQMAALKDVSRRWHVPPAFSVEFVAYYLERNGRVAALRRAAELLAQDNDRLIEAEARNRPTHDEATKSNALAMVELKLVRDSLERIYGAMNALTPKILVPEIVLERPLLPPVYQRSTPKVTPQQLQKRSMPVPTAAALKMGVGFPLSDRQDARIGKVLSTSMEASSLGEEADVSRTCGYCSRASARHMMAACDTCHSHYHLHCLRPPLQRPPKKTKLYGWQCSECDKTSESEPEVMEKKVPRRSRIRYSKDGAILPESSPPSSPPQKKGKHRSKPQQPKMSPIKVTIKPFEFSSENEGEVKKRGKKIKKKQKVDVKKRKRSFTSPTLTNTPLMSITPIIADSPDSQNENSNHSTVASKQDNSFLSPNSSFSSLLTEKERDSKTIESSIESTLANLSSDIATYKANRKRRKEKHRSRYSPDLLRSPSKHKHKRKKKNQDIENPGLPHPRITIKIKPIPKPDGSLDTQMFYVPTDSNDGPPSLVKETRQKKDSSDSKDSMQSKSSKENRNPTPVPTPAPQENQIFILGPKELAEIPLATPPRPIRARSGLPAAVNKPLTQCDVCSGVGDTTNIVRCDECLKRYHFTCLEPPLQKNPKKRGYSWHCAECDPTDVEEVL